MRKIKAFISYIIIIAIMISLIPFKALEVNAATAANLSVQTYRYNSTSGKYELTVTWQGNKAIKGARIEYYDDTGALFSSAIVGTVEIESVNLTTSKFSAKFDASNLKEDYLYNITVRMYDKDGNDLGSSALYFMTGISFTSERVERSLPSGVFESGTSPELKLSWKVPRIWNGTSWDLITTSSSKTLINSNLPTDRKFDEIDFKVNISTRAQTLDSGADIAPLFINENGSTYSASTASGTPKEVVIGADDYMSVNIVGRKDAQETPKFEDDDTRLYHNQIQPGTVYFMNVKPTFSNTAGEKVDVLTLGDPSQYNGSLVKDAASGLGYTYTPIRFKITRDAADNVYVTAYRINKDDGSVDMPNLYYSIQAIDTPIATYGVDWPEKARMTDQFFPNDSEYAVTVITGIDVNTPMYYKVVVKTDSKADRIESLKMKYQMSVDKSKPPIPVNVKVDMTKSVLVTGNANDPATGEIIKDKSGNPLNIRSTDILLTWDKPTNFENLSDSEKSDLIYHVEINTNIDDLKTKYPLEFAGLEMEYILKYRWVKSIPAKDVTISGTKLTYTIKGFELFQNFKNPDGTLINDGKIENPDDYPEWLVENTIYYVKMFATKSFDGVELDSIGDLKSDGIINEEDFSEYAKANIDPTPENVVSQTSVITSFTTLPGVNKQVPVPTGFKATSENVNTSTMKNYITLQFDRTIIDWDTFTATGGNVEAYQLFMASGSSDNPEYTQVGSTDTATNVTFSLVNGVWTVLVPDLKQNTTYRFKLRLKLDFADTSMTDMFSDFTAVVSVTTRKIEILPPDSTAKVPMAPVDFRIATNSEGEQDLTGTGVGLAWSILEDDVTYELVATTTRIDVNAEVADFNDDAYYESFHNKFGDGTTDDVDALDPDYPGGYFSSDHTALSCKYRVDEAEGFMVPNNLYFYSIRAQRTVSYTDTDGTTKTKTLSSQWVTIPVTTSMLEAPYGLENIQDYELGMDWTDTDSSVKAEDYTIYMKKASETEYKALDISKATIIKDTSANKFYGRVRGLEAATSYDFEARKGNTAASVQAVDLGTLTTRNQYQNIEIRFVAIPGDFEIAIRDEKTDEYSTISQTDSSSTSNPANYEIRMEKTQELLGTGYYYYYVRILKAEVTLNNGDEKYLALKSNTKYYIKVRTIKDGQQPSKYVGPVTARTSFNQGDYDDGEDLDDVNAKLVDMIKKIEEKPYYSLNYVLTTTNTLLLKGDRLAEELKADPYHKLQIDLTTVSSAGREDEIYIPEYLAQTLRDSNGSITFVLDNSEYTLVSTSLVEDFYKEAEDIRDDYDEKEIWYKLSISRPDGGTEGIEANIEPISDVNILEFEIVGVSKAYSDIKKDFVNKVYNSETGLVKKKKDELADLYTTNPDSIYSQGDYLVEMLVNEVEEELADYVKETIEGDNGSTGIILETSSVKELSGPAIVKMSIEQSDDYGQLYGIYPDKGVWNKLPVVSSSSSQITFEIYKPGKYFIGVAGNFAASMPKDHWAYKTIIDFNNSYNIADIFQGNFNPDAAISFKDSILILDKVFAKGSVNGETLQKKISKLDLSDYFKTIAPVKDLTREQAATLYIKSYCNINGLEINNLRPDGTVVINDYSAINQFYYNNVENSVALDFIELDASGNFMPEKYVTRAEFITALNKALKR